MNKSHRKYPTRADLDAELRKVATASKAVLRNQYKELFDRDPPKAFGPDLLRRGVAYRLQENALGGLSKATRRELNRLVKRMIEQPNAQFTVARRAKSGTVLVRDWKGKNHRVMILESGFEYEGRAYTNLSEIARNITGTRWNGPRFFGLRRAPTKDARTSSPTEARAPSVPLLPRNGESIFPQTRRSKRPSLTAVSRGL